MLPPNGHHTIGQRTRCGEGNEAQGFHGCDGQFDHPKKCRIFRRARREGNRPLADEDPARLCSRRYQGSAREFGRSLRQRGAGLSFAAPRRRGDRDHPRRYLPKPDVGGRRDGRRSRSFHWPRPMRPGIKGHGQGDRARSRRNCRPKNGFGQGASGMVNRRLFLPKPRPAAGEGRRRGFGEGALRGVTVFWEDRGPSTRAAALLRPLPVKKRGKGERERKKRVSCFPKKPPIRRDLLSPRFGGGRPARFNIATVVAIAIAERPPNPAGFDLIVEEEARLYASEPASSMQ